MLERKFDYLSMIENQNARKYLENFFNPYIIKDIPHKELKKLVDDINEEIPAANTKFNTNDPAHILDEATQNSKIHKSFLNIVSKYFGKDAKKLLTDRKNITLMNLKEVIALKQEIFDNLGEKFVNTVLNLDIQDSLIVLPKLIGDKNEMKKFKFFYDFYMQNIGSSPEHYDKLFLKYTIYESLITELVKNNTKLTTEQKSALKEIFRDSQNIYSINTIKQLDDYYKIKDQRHQVFMANAIKYQDIDTLKNNITLNYFGIPYTKRAGQFNAGSKNLRALLLYYDIDDILNNKQKIDGIEFSNEELDILKDLKEIAKADFDTLLAIDDKYAKKGNKISATVLQLIDKIPLTFTKDIMNSITKVSDLETKYNNHEDGIEKTQTEGIPTYKLTGTDFSFLQTTTFVNSTGLSGFKIKGDVAESWFTFENGASHISCSYISQDKLCSIEFTDTYTDKSKVSYLFDEADILTMGADDIYTPSESRIANITSSSSTKFMYAKKLLKKSGLDNEINSFDYNEIGINRYNNNTGTIRFGGKIIPSAIVVNGKIEQYHIDAAKSFTEFLTKNGLKGADYKMPIIVVDKKIYKNKQLAKLYDMLQPTTEEEIKLETEEQQKEGQKQKIVTQGGMK